MLAATGAFVGVAVGRGVGLVVGRGTVAVGRSVGVAVAPGVERELGSGVVVAMGVGVITATALGEGEGEVWPGDADQPVASGEPNDEGDPEPGATDPQLATTSAAVSARHARERIPNRRRVVTFHPSPYDTSSIGCVMIEGNGRWSRMSTARRPDGIRPGQC